mgnify:CR=1 FL=1
MDQIHNKLIVSCQALENEPLHSSFIMSRMALAAKEGGAQGIRANSTADLEEIRKQVDLPVIGIIKRNYGDHPCYITPTLKEIDELMSVHPEIIAMDACCKDRPDGKSLEEVFLEAKDLISCAWQTAPLLKKLSLQTVLDLISLEQRWWDIPISPEATALKKKTSGFCGIFFPLYSIQ